MKFYLAGSWKHQASCRVTAGIIESRLGWKSTAQWLHSAADDNDPKAVKRGADACINDIAKSNVVVAFIGDRASLGKHVEIGAALATDKRVILVWAPWAALRDYTKCAFYELCEGPIELNDLLERGGA